MVDKWVLMTLINGLHDGETQQSVLSKVDEMNLEDTIVFVEAREVGRHSVKILSGGLTSSQVNRVNVQDTGTCSYCGKKAMVKTLTETSGEQTALPGVGCARNVSRRIISLTSVPEKVTRRKNLLKIHRRPLLGLIMSPSTQSRCWKRGSLARCPE